MSSTSRCSRPNTCPRNTPPAGAYAAAASGLVAVGISRVPRDYVLWFRPEFGRTVRWAGDPSKPIKVDRHGARLTPRGSFSEWLEVSRMHSAPWSVVDLEAAEALRVVLLESVLKSVDLARRERDVEATRAMAEELERRVAERTEQLRALASPIWRRPRSGSGGRSPMTCTTISDRRSPPHASGSADLCRRTRAMCGGGERGRLP